MEDLKVKLSEATGMDKEEQELLAASGQPVESTALVADFCLKNNQVGRVKLRVFVKDDLTLSSSGKVFGFAEK